jgi:N-acetyl-gamma-glutamyl-phosphate reductase
LPYQVYGLGLNHKHVPEIQQFAGLTHAPVFVPSYGHYRQGIVLTIALHLRLLPAGVGAAQLQAALQAHYAGQPFIEVQPLAEGADAQRLDPQALNGSNRLQLSVFAQVRSGQARTGQVLLAAVFDNLGKGAAGAAVQNLELMLGLQRQPGHHTAEGVARDQPVFAGTQRAPSASSAALSTTTPSAALSELSVAMAPISGGPTRKPL